MSLQDLLKKYTSLPRESPRESSTSEGNAPSTKRSFEATTSSLSSSSAASSSSSMSSASSNAAKRRRELDAGIVPIYFLCNEGSVTHFYHFMLGALVPLIEYHLTTKRDSFRIKTDIGPMKSILCEMPFNIVEICGPSNEPISASAHYKAHDDKSAYSGLTLEPGEVRLPAYDSFDQFIYDDAYAPKFTHRCRANILAFFQAHTPSYISSIRPIKILLIDRKVDTYYQQVKHHNRTEIYGTSGAQRRRIDNHQELADALKSKYGDDFINISLERTSIFYQYHMFRSAKVVIAQHGAALTNIFFMQENSHAIEIRPMPVSDRQHFRNLSTVCKVGYTLVNQEKEHSCVDVNDIMGHVEEALLKHSSA